MIEQPCMCGAEDCGNCHPELRDELRAEEAEAERLFDMVEDQEADVDRKFRYL